MSSRDDDVNEHEKMMRMEKRMRKEKVVTLQTGVTLFTSMLDELSEVSQKKCILCFAGPKELRQ